MIVSSVVSSPVVVLVAGLRRERPPAVREGVRDRRPVRDDDRARGRSRGRRDLAREGHRLGNPLRGRAAPLVASALEVPLLRARRAPIPGELLDHERWCCDGERLTAGGTDEAAAAWT